MNLARVESAIESLRNISSLQGSMIHSLEAYERIVEGGGNSNRNTSGYCNGYATELQYLKTRRAALDEAIISVQRYAQGALTPGHFAAPVSVG